MLKIVLGFAVIFMLIYSAYKYIVGLDSDKLEALLEQAPTIALSVFAAIFTVLFIVISF